MGASNGATMHLEMDQVGTVRRTPNAPSGNIYVSRSARNRPDGNASTQWLRHLASEGRLAQTAGGPERPRLTGAAYELVWPVVFTRLTRRLEHQRGHVACAAGVDRLADECLDRFQDDVEAVVDDLLANARQPIVNLEAWVSARLGPATVNAYRRRRGHRGALQRPRLPGWLVAELGDDPWLHTLATNVLVWVGIGDTAGAEVWPIESWAQERARRHSDWTADERTVVEREVAIVLNAMRTRPAWYESFVERPLGTKSAPVAAYAENADPLVLGDPDGSVESELARLASTAVQAIDERVGTGEAPGPAVAEVIQTVFGGVFTGTLDRAPHGSGDPLAGITDALADKGRLERILRAVQVILAEQHATAADGSAV